MSHLLRMPGIPDHAREMLKRLMAEDLIPAEALPHIVESYRRVIQEAHQRNGRANIAIGNAIADALRALLASVSSKTGEKNLRIIQAAVRYFVIQNDGNGSDLASEQGLDDDAEILNTVLRFFGRDDLMIDVPDRDAPTRRASPRPAPRANPRPAPRRANARRQR